MKLNDKQINILHAAIRLINKGIKFHKIKVSDIAVEAGVGKGTVYEYFESKEDLLKEAVVLSVNEQIELACKEIESVEGFKNKFYTFMSIMDRENDNVLGVAKNLIVPMENSEEFDRLFKNMPKISDYGFGEIELLTQNFIQEGIKEGRIRSDIDKDTFICAAVGVVSSYIFYLNNKKLYESNMDSMKQKTFEMFLGAVNA